MHLIHFCCDVELWTIYFVLFWYDSTNDMALHINWYAIWPEQEKIKSFCLRTKKGIKSRDQHRWVDQYAYNPIPGLFPLEDLPW